MADYTPTTEEVRDAVLMSGRPFDQIEETTDPHFGYELHDVYVEPGMAFDRWLAAHDAEVRASVLAEQGEPEWEYAWAADEAVRSTLRPRGPRIMLDDVPTTPEAIANFPRGLRIRRRKAGPWLPVEQKKPGSTDGSER